MPLLEAFLALALTMLSLAMIATLIVEVVNRAAGIRAKGLKMMLDAFYDRELQSLVDSELKDAVKWGKTELIDHLASNPLVKGKAVTSFFKRNMAGLESLSTEDLLKRLTHTEIGDHIKAKSEQEIDAFVESISRTYEACGKAASELFRQNARIISFYTGIVVAVGLNVNALMVFQMYLDDPHLRAQAVAEADTIVKRFEKNIGEIDAGTAAATAGAAANEDNHSPTDPPDPQQIEQIKKQSAQLKEQIASMKDEIKELDSLGVKIGWHPEKPPVTFWKSSMPAGSSGGSRWQTLGRMLSTWTFWEWLLGVVGTGLLIGLGGPFWYDVVYKLSDLIQVAKGGGTPANVPQPGAAAPIPPADPMDHFKETFKKTGNTQAAIKAKNP